MPTLNSPTSSSSQDDWSLSGSSSRSSMAPPVSRQQAREMTLSELSTTKLYRMELKVYLTVLLEKEASQGVATKRITARRKQSKLNNGQFMELARDVYDEMIRRTSHDRKDPFLPLHDEFHPRRNQARQKLATIPEYRFMDLSSDVYHELSRRYPHTRMEKNDALPPLPITESVNKNEWFPQTVVPEKCLIRIDDIQQEEEQAEEEFKSYPVHPLDPPNDIDSSSNWTDSLDSLIADIDSMVKPKSNEITRSRTHSKQSINDELLKQRIRELEDKEKAIQQKCDQLETENKQLLHQRRQQEEVVHKVKKEIVELLHQLDTLSTKNGNIMTERDDAYEQIDKLQDQIKEWQAKHTVLQRQMDEKCKSTMPNDDGMDLHAFLKPDANGALSYETIITYQACMDDLVEKSRTSQPVDILPCINDIVKICKVISDQVDDKTEDSDHDPLMTIQRQYSLALHHLLSASKGYVHGSGLYPLSLLHASASHLTNVVIELIQLLGVCK